MGDKPKTGTPESGEATSSQPETSPGVGSLLRGAKSEDKNVFAETAATAEPGESATKTDSTKPLIPRWYFFSADVLLVAFAIAVACKNPWPLQTKPTIICVVLVVLASILGACGVFVGRK